ncbi:MAG: glycosyltransferase family 39 protein [Chthoniobacterales bacterium]|nr:glycosyltransferase family 39 protein [Chthoniobacterales bacterium]
MEETDAPIGLTNRWTRRAILAFVILLFAITNLPWTLDDYDQAKQAYTSFEMVGQGHWLYQHTPNEGIATKPPLVGWISAGLFEVTRSWEAAWRVPSFAAAIVLLWLIGWAARAAYGSTAGLLAMSAFGLNLLSPRLAALVRTDMPLALVTFLVGLQIWHKIRRGQEWNSRDRMAAFALLAFAMWIKGPIIYAFILPGLVAYRFLRPMRDVAPGMVRNGAADAGETPALQRRSDAWSGWWPWILSFAIFLAWVMGGIVRQPGFYESVVLKEFAGRFIETVHKPQPIYFYLPHLLHKFAPWSLLIIGLAIVFWRERGTRQLQATTLWLVCWSVGGLLLMSVIPSKRVDRIFPIVPPLCLLLGAQVACVRRGSRREAFLPWLQGALLFAFVFTGGYAAWKIGSSARANADALVRFSREVRDVAKKNHWRYGVLGGREEGMLLYLRRDHFLTPDDAVRQWHGGALDALVVPNPSALPSLAGAKPFFVSEKSSAVPQYSLIVREP